MSYPCDKSCRRGCNVRHSKPRSCGEGRHEYLLYLVYDEETEGIWAKPKGTCNRCFSKAPPNKLESIKFLMVDSDSIPEGDVNLKEPSADGFYY